MTLLVLWLVGGIIVGKVFALVAYHDRVMTETADDRMWDRSIADYHPSVRIPK